MNIKIITIGNKTSENLLKIIQEYDARMPSSISIDWCFIKSSNQDKNDNCSDVI